METHTTAGPATGADLTEQLVLSVQQVQIDRLRRLDAALDATVTTDITPLRQRTRARCADHDDRPGTVTVSFFPGFEGAAHRFYDGVCINCAEWVMRHAVEAHRTTYLDVEVWRVDPRDDPDTVKAGDAARHARQSRTETAR